MVTRIAMRGKHLLTLLIFMGLSSRLLAQDGRVILKVFALPDPKSTSAFDLAEMAVVEAFKAKYPTIELRQFSGITVEGMSWDSAPLLAIAGGVAPDILYVNFRQSHTYIQNHFLYPMDEFAAGESVQDMDFRVAGPVWPVIKRNGPEGVTHLWALPYGTLVRTLVYRKDLFAKAGLDPDKPPRTWDELLSCAKKLTLPEEGIFGLQLSGSFFVAWDWLGLIWSAGGEAFRTDPKTGQWYACFNDAPAIDALEFYLKLVATEWYDSQGGKNFGYTRRDGNLLFWEEGKIGMMMRYLTDKDVGGSFDPNLVGVAPVPLSWAGQRASELQCTMMGIFSGAGESNNSGLGPRDPRQVKDAAWKYIWFYDCEEARKIRVKTMVEAGFGRMQNPVYLKRYGYESYVKYSRPDWLEIYEDTLRNAKPEPFGKNCQRIYEYMGDPLEKCVSLEKKGLLGRTPEERRKKIKEILDEGVARTNKEMIGILAPEERVTRDRLALLCAGFIGMAFTMVLYKTWRIFTPTHRTRGEGLWAGKYFCAYLLLFPALGSILLWKYVPILMGSLIAFQDYQVVGPSEWVGLQNFADVLFDPRWWWSLLKTFHYMFLLLLLGFLPPLFLAILLQEIPRGKIFYRTLYYMPAVSTGVMAIYLWKILYDPSASGLLNQLLRMLGLEKLDWLNDESLAMICCAVPVVWAELGPGCLIYLAALKTIPDDLYEAAEIDGAGFIHKVVHVVLPSLKSLLIIQFISAFIMASQQTDYIMVMTFGGPSDATKVSGFYIFEKAYLYLKFGSATTMAWMLGLLLMGFTVIQLRKLSQMEFRSTGK